MITFDPAITFSAGAIVGALAMKIIDHQLAKSRSEEDRKIKDFNEAARAFKNSIRTELEGIYHAKSGWGAVALPTIKEKTIKIRRYADTFADFLGGSSKREFSEAIKAYCEYCDSITPAMCDQSTWFPNSSMPMKPEVRDARLKFDKHVDDLLSFAKEK